jgi:rhomboid protease GluP
METSRHFEPAHRPIATICVLSLTAASIGLQFLFPQMLEALERKPGRLSAGEWWRLSTPIFVHHGGWPGIVFNFVSIAIVGVIVERLMGSRQGLLLYFAAGITGEVCGVAWQPVGAGASVAGAGLLGCLAMYLLLRVPTPPAWLGGSLILMGAMVLPARRDIHGPPVLTGALMGAVMLFRSRNVA